MRLLLALSATALVMPLIFAGTPTELPSTVTLQSDVVFKVPFSPDNSEFMVNRGSQVRLVAIKGDKLLLRDRLGEAVVSPHLTDLNPDLIAQINASKADRITQALQKERQRKSTIDDLNKRGIFFLAGRVFQSVGAGFLVRSGSDDVILLKTQRFLKPESNIECWAQETGQRHTYKTVADTENSIPVWIEIPPPPIDQ